MTIREEVGRLADGLETLLREKERERQQAQYREDAEYLASHKGRRELRQTTLAEFFDRTAVPGLLKMKVPDEFWIENRGLAVVSCPCGEMPEIEREGLTECACGRIFVYSGTQVRVWPEEETSVA